LTRGKKGSVGGGGSYKWGVRRKTGNRVRESGEFKRSRPKKQKFR